MKKSVALLSNCWVLAPSFVAGSDIGNVLPRTVIDLVLVVTVETLLLVLKIAWYLRNIFYYVLFGTNRFFYSNRQRLPKQVISLIWNIILYKKYILKIKYFFTPKQYCMTFDTNCRLGACPAIVVKRKSLEQICWLDWSQNKNNKF